MIQRFNRIVIVFIALIILSASLKFAQAALAISDTLSDSRPAVVSNHEINWTVSDAGGIQEGEEFTTTFAASFDTSQIAVGDVDLLDDEADLTLAANCAGGAEASFVNNDDDTFTFTICVGGGGAIASGSLVTVKIGTNASGGTNQIANPSSAGSFGESMAGASGYADSDTIEIYITDGVSTTATVGAQSGSIRITGYASPSATVQFIESGSTIGSASTNANSYYDKTIAGLSAGLHTVSIHAVDVDARSSRATSINLNVTAGSTTTYGNLILPPTVSISSNEISRPAELIASGKAVNNSLVQVFIDGTGNDGTTFSVSTDTDGSWSANLNSLLHLGLKTTYMIALDGTGGQSSASDTFEYTVVLSADLNNDGVVNDLDLDILRTSWGSTENVAADINDDGVVNVVDFSIMMNKWTI